MNRTGRIAPMVAVVAIVVVAGVAACSKSAPEAAASMSPPPPPAPPAMEESAKADMAASPSVQSNGARGGGPGGFDEADGLASMEAKPKPSRMKANKKGGAKESEDKNEGGGEDAPAMRAWFPETFLFEPAVATDAAGKAEVSVRMPDRLTSWRILALAHSRAGAQGGAVKSIATTMPAYVDVVAPAALLTGDEAYLPVQVVNTTDALMSLPLVVEAQGARIDGAPGTLSVPARGTRTAWVRLVAERPGTAVVRARYGGEDQVERTVPIAAAGRPRAESRGGTLAAPREIAIVLPSGVDVGSVKVRAVVVPGALGVLRGELLDAPSREGVDDVAYALSLVGRAPALATSLGEALDEPERKKATQRAAQRALRLARAPGEQDAITLLRGAALVQDGGLVEALAARLDAQVARAQRPDGTFLGGDGWQLSRLLVATADGVAALEAGRSVRDGASRALGARARASLAFQRNIDRVDEAYTAASILACGALEGAAKQKLIDVVAAAVQPRDDGAKVVPVPKTAQRPDGASPTELETTALALLALLDDPKSSAVVNDLGAAVLSGYRPGRGFGDGRTNDAALRAIAALFKDPLPQTVALQLNVDGKTVAFGAIERGRDLAPVVLDARVDERAGPRKITIAADPPVPGLAYTVTVSWSEPWPKGVDDGGLALLLDAPKDARLGRPVDVTLRANAPGGAPLTIRHALPAGVSPDRVQLEGLRSSGVLTSFTIEEGALVLTVPSRAQGQAFSIVLRYVPSVAGRLSARPSTVKVSGRADEVVVPTAAWSVGR